MLYSTRMDRGGSSGRVAELFQGTLTKTVGFGGCEQYDFLKADIFEENFCQPSLRKFKFYQFEQVSQTNTSKQTLEENLDQTKLANIVPNKGPTLMRRENLMYYDCKDFIRLNIPSGGCVEHSNWLSLMHRTSM